MTTKKLGAASLGTLIGLYVFSYITLSSFGKYAVTGWHMLTQHGPQPMFYHWAPAGFYDVATGEWQGTPMYFYLPLLIADDWFWHTENPHPELSHLPMHPAVFPAGSFKSSSR